MLSSPSFCLCALSQAPDDAVLCTCSAKKVRWYVERELADVVQEEPLTARLRFEPRGRGHADDQFYLVGIGTGWEPLGIFKRLLRSEVALQPRSYLYNQSGV